MCVRGGEVCCETEKQISVIFVTTYFTESVADHELVVTEALGHRITLNGVLVEIVLDAA